MKRGVFTENFVRIDTNDTVAGVMLIKRRKGETIDFQDESSDLQILSKQEALELIRLIQEGMDKL